MALVLLPILLLVPIAALVLLAWALVDLLSYPEHVWVSAGESKLIWALVVIFVGLIGPILYLAIARPKLKLIPV